MSDSFTSSFYYYSSATSTTNGTETSGHRYTTTSHTDPSGNTIVRTAHQDLGEPAVIEERRYDRTGQELTSDRSTDDGGGGNIQRISDLTTDENYNYDMTAKGPAPVDTNDSRIDSLKMNISPSVSQDIRIPPTNTPADDTSGTDMGRYRSDIDEGAIDPVTGKKSYARDVGR